MSVVGTCKIRHSLSWIGECWINNAFNRRKQERQHWFSHRRPWSKAKPIDTREPNQAHLEGTQSLLLNQMRASQIKHRQQMTALSQILTKIINLEPPYSTPLMGLDLEGSRLRNLIMDGQLRIVKWPNRPWGTDCAPTTWTSGRKAGSTHTASWRWSITRRSEIRDYQWFTRN